MNAPFVESSGAIIAWLVRRNPPAPIRLPAALNGRRHE
jgi:hypothetical protein